MASMQAEAAQADDDFDTPQRDTRGWAMRRGHGRRLRRDSGRESIRGRAAFARTANVSSKRYHADWRPSKQAARRQVLASAFGAEASVIQRHRPVAVRSVQAEVCQHKNEHQVESRFLALECEVEESCIDYLVDDIQENGEATEKADVESLSAPAGQPTLMRSRSVPGSPAEVSFARQRVVNAYVPLRAWPTRRPCEKVCASVSVELTPRSVRAQRWLDALALADRVAKSYVSVKEVKNEPKQARERRESPVRSTVPGFEVIREEFLKTHGEAVRANLASVWGPDVHLKPAPLADPICRRFVDAYQKGLKTCVMKPTLHGTSFKNHESIFQQGLLIPRETQIQHGANHGRGIYSATLKNAALACGFCSTGRILVCAVLDDAIDVPPFRCGRFTVYKESALVRHVGDALVAFDPARIAPLFEAYTEREWAPSAPAPVTMPIRSQTTVQTSIRNNGGALATKLVERYREPTESVPARRLRRPSHATITRVHHRATDFLSRRAAQKRR